MRALLPALLLAAFAGSAAAQSVDAANPKSVADALLKLGYRAKLETDSEGDPVVRSAIEGIDYSVFFYGCNGGKLCKYVVFTASFDLRDGMTLEAINEWNRAKIIGQAHLDDEMDPHLEYFLTTIGGLNQANFADAVDWWGVTMAEFKTHIGW